MSDRSGDDGFSEEIGAVILALIIGLYFEITTFHSDHLHNLAYSLGLSNVGLTKSKSQQMAFLDELETYDLIRNGQGFISEINKMSDARREVFSDENQGEIAEFKVNVRDLVSRVERHGIERFKVEADFSPTYGSLTAKCYARNVVERSFLLALQPEQVVLLRGTLDEVTNSSRVIVRNCLVTKVCERFSKC